MFVFVPSSQVGFAATLFQVADSVLQILADSQRAATIWYNAVNKYQMTRLSHRNEYEITNIVEIFCEAVPPQIPSDWEMELIEHGATFSNGNALWLVVADSLIVMPALPSNRIQIWVGHTKYAHSAEGLEILMEYILSAILRYQNQFEG